MPRGSWGVYKMVVDNVDVGLIALQQDVIDRFNITGLTAPDTSTGVTRERKAHQRKVYTNRNTASTTRTINVQRVVVADIKRKNRVNSGKKIKVPLDLTSTAASSGTGTTGTTARQTQRMTTINFPLKASNYQVARWINVNFTANKPSYFITPAGARFPVNIPAIAAQTAGEDTTP